MNSAEMDQRHPNHPECMLKMYMTGPHLMSSDLEIPR